MFKNIGVILRTLRYYILLTILLIYSVDTLAQDDNKGALSLFGDFRFRPEQDWDSRNFDGSFREDRFRLRYRLRFGFKYDYNEYISFGARIRTGVNESLQSPHNNFGHREFTGIPINFDMVYLKGDYEKFWWLIGKDKFPFWTQNELFWDEDVTPEGMAIGAKLKHNGLSIKPKLGYFITNTGSGDFDPNDPTNGSIDGHMLAGQIELGIEAQNTNITVASGFFSLKNINNVPTTDFYYSGTRFKLDYSFIVSSIQVKIPTKKPLTIGVDHFLNIEDYSNYPDSLINPVFQDQNQGLVLSATIGQMKSKGDWLLGYYYAYKEEYAVVSYYTEDDWIRLGNINRNRNTNYQGHEIRFGYAFSDTFNLLARTYLVNGLVTAHTTTENGKRFRIDLNIKFNRKF